jgi:SAM-dependent methyltransferase
MASKARYDAVADWYPSWVGDGGGLIAEDGGDLLPSTLRGSRVLDVACGHGRASRAGAPRRRCRRADLPPHHSDGPAHEGCATD